MKRLLLLIPIMLFGCMTVHAQRILITDASRVVFEYNPTVNTGVSTNGNDYRGILTVDTTEYPITQWESCAFTVVVTCKFPFSDPSVVVLNTIGDHTVKLRLILIADPTKVGPDSNTIVWSSKPDLPTPPQPTMMRILP